VVGLPRTRSSAGCYSDVFFAKRVARRDLRRAACRLWTIPFAAALSSKRFATFTESAAAAGSRPSMVTRACRIMVLTRDRTLRFRSRSLRDRMTSFFDDLMFGK